MAVEEQDEREGSQARRRRFPGRGGTPRAPSPNSLGRVLGHVADVARRLAHVALGGVADLRGPGRRGRRWGREGQWFVQEGRGRPARARVGCNGSSPSNSPSPWWPHPWRSPPAGAWPCASRCPACRPRQSRARLQERSGGRRAVGRAARAVGGGRIAPWRTPSAPPRPSAPSSTCWAQQLGAQGACGGAADGGERRHDGSGGRSCCCEAAGAALEGGGGAGAKRRTRVGQPLSRDYDRSHGGSVSGLQRSAPSATSQPCIRCRESMGLLQSPDP